MLTPDWLCEGPVAKVLSALESNGHPAFVVGGAVRNLIMGLPAKDFDIATSATPEEVEAIFADKAHVVPTGVDHGTVTVVMGGLPVEVTTFRRDVATDGRRAVVEYATGIDDDARRRDFTMNAIYLDQRGSLSDPVGGVKDAKLRRLRFIGDARQRIREDYLRSLRFFRLFAAYADPSDGFDETAIAAIAEQVDGLTALSVERVTEEIIKLLSARDPAFAVAGMERAGVLSGVLPGAATEGFFELVHIENKEGLDSDPIRRLASLVQENDLRLSKKARRRFDLLIELRSSDAGLAEIAWRHDAVTALDTAVLRAAGLSIPFHRQSTEGEISKGQGAVLPISARDLMPELRGKALGEALDQAISAWIGSDFELDKESLLRIALQKG